MIIFLILCLVLVNLLVIYVDENQRSRSAFCKINWKTGNLEKPTLQT